MMMHSSAEQLRQIFVFLGFGSLVGIAAAWRTILATHRKPSAPRRFAGDCLFCIVTLLLLFLVSLAVSAGELRAVTVGFVLTGGSLSFYLFRPVFKQIFRASQALRRLVFRLFSPIGQMLCKIFSFFCKKIGFFCKKGLRYKYVMMYNRNK